MFDITLRHLCSYKPELKSYAKSYATTYLAETLTNTYLLARCYATAT